MGKFTINILNQKQKEIKVFNRNYFYLATFLFIGALVLTYFMFEKQIDQILLTNKLYNILLLPFQHADIGHLVGNIISFFVVSLFLERHFGSIKYLLLIIFIIPLSSISTFLFSNSFAWVGESGVNYFLYSLFVVIVIFNFKDYILSKWQNIFTLFIIVAICLLMCWNGSTSAFTENISEFFKFGVFTDLLSNVGHWSSAIMGGAVGLFANIFSLANGKKSDF